MLKVGDKAPQFSGTDHTGHAVSLKDFAGKTLVMWFFPKADTPGCTAEGCSFRDLQSDLEQKNVAVLGVSFDSQEDNKKFAQKFNFKFPLLCDTTREVGLAYGAATDAKAEHAQRIGVVIDPQGTIQEWHAKVDARTFPAEVAARL